MTWYLISKHDYYELYITLILGKILIFISKPSNFQIVPRKPLFLGRNLRKVHKILRKNAINQKSTESKTVISSSSNTVNSTSSLIEDDSSKLKQDVSISTVSSSSTIIKTNSDSPIKNMASSSALDNEPWNTRLVESGINDNYIVFDNEEFKINFANYKRVFLLHKHISLFKKNSLRQAKRVSLCSSETWKHELTFKYFRPTHLLQNICIKNSKYLKISG